MTTNWNDKATIDSFVKTAHNLRGSSDADTLMHYYRALQALLRGADKAGIDLEARDGYEHALAYAGLAWLPYMSATDAFDLLDHSIVYLLDEQDAILSDQLHHLLLTMDSLDDRDDLKQRIREALLHSDKVITDSSSPGVDGTIAGWLGYVLKVTSGQQTDSLKMANLFATDAAIQTLSREERNHVEKLLKLFAQVSASSITPEGLEDEIIADDDERNEITIYDQMGVRTIRKDEDPLFARRAPELSNGIQQIWLSQAQKLTPLEVEADTFAKESEMREVKAKEVLTAPAADAKMVVAALRVYAPGKSMEELVAPWQANAATVPVVCQALQKLLVTDLKLADVHAAAIVWRLIERLKESDQQKYRDLVYYDMESGYFHWNEAYAPQRGVTPPTV